VGSTLVKPPGDALVVADDDEGHTGEGDSCDVECSAAKVSFVPEVGHLVAEVHVIGE